MSILSAIVLFLAIMLSFASASALIEEARGRVETDSDVIFATWIYGLTALFWSIYFTWL